MSGVVRIRSLDAPQTFKVKASTTVRGGMLVEAVSGGGVQPASAGSVRVLGVAQKDGFGAGAITADTVSDSGQPLVDLSGPNPDTVTAEKGGFKVTYASNAAFGDPLKAAANGQVTKWVSGTDTDPRTIVGYCRVEAGVLSGTVAEAIISGNA